MYRKELVQIVSENDLVNLFLYKWKLYSSKVEPTQFGKENISLIIDNKFILRILKPTQTRSRLESIISLMEFLHRDNIKVPEIVRTALDEQFASLEINGLEIRAILTKLIDGQHPSSFIEDQCRGVARGIARLHSSTQEIAKQSKQPLKFTIESYKSIDKNKVKNQQVLNFLGEMERFTTDCSKCSIAIAHGDLTNENILFRGNVLTGILDFDDFFLGPAVYDIATYLYDINKYLKGQKWLEASRSFLQEYIRTFPLKQIDLEKIKDLLMYRNFVISSFYSVYVGEDKFDWSSYIEFNDYAKTLDFVDILS